MRTGALVRRHRVATCALAVLAGLAAAVPLATWAAGRRTAVAIDQFLTRSEPPDVLIDFCPEGVEPGSPDELQTCNAYVPSAELDAIRSMPGVRLAARASWTMMLLATSVDGPRRPATMMQIDGADLPTWSGVPVARRRPPARKRRARRAARQRRLGGCSRHRAGVGHLGVGAR